MEPTITAYEFSYINQQVTHLVNTYKSVNDPHIRDIVLAETLENLTPLLPSDEPITEAFLQGVKIDFLSRVQAADLIETLIPLVIPFPKLSPKQLEKLFKKVKKLKQPEWGSLKLHELTYLGWNDGGNQKKYLVAPYQDRLIGIQGEFSPQTVKGLCAICHTIGNVSLFMSTTKTSGLGTYTKNGNYICRDSAQCNRQLTDPLPLADFLTTVRPKK